MAPRWMPYLPVALLSAAAVLARVEERTARGWNPGCGCCGWREGGDVGCVVGWEAAEAGIPPPPDAADGVVGGPRKPANGTGVGAETLGPAAVRGGAGEAAVRLATEGDGQYSGGESPGMLAAASVPAAGGGELTPSRDGKFWACSGRGSPVRAHVKAIARRVMNSLVYAPNRLEAQLPSSPRPPALLAWFVWLHWYSGPLSELSTDAASLV